MDKDLQAQKRFLEQQFQWNEEQICILDEIDKYLHQMKEIAEYAFKHELTMDEIERLTNQLNELKGVIHCLEKQLHSVIH